MGCEALAVRKCWYRVRSRLKVGRAGLFPTQLGNVLRQPETGEASDQLGAERCPRNIFVSDGIAKDFADLLLGALPMTTRTALKLGFHVFFEVPDQDLSKPG